MNKLILKLVLDLLSSSILIYFALCATGNIQYIAIVTLSGLTILNDGLIFCYRRKDYLKENP